MAMMLLKLVTEAGMTITHIGTTKCSNLHMNKTIYLNHILPGLLSPRIL